MAALRLRTTLALAALGHLAIVASLTRPGARPSPVAPQAPIHEISLEDELPSREDPALPASPSGAAADPSPEAPRRAHAVAMARPIGAEAEPAAAKATATASEPGESAVIALVDPNRRGPVDLGLGTTFRVLGSDGSGRGPSTSAAPPPSADRDPARARAQEVDRSMREMLGARDVALGLGRGGPLVAAVHAAASGSGAPDVGVTILEVETDAAGTVVRAQADDRAWNDVAAAVVHRMAGKALRTGPHARGLRARLRVVAERAKPSGSGGSSSVGAVPDDVAGGRDTVCQGKGVTRRCVAGMPVGVTSSNHDVSNLGAKPARIVHVALLGETEL